MSAKHDAILAAYRVFGLEGDEDFDTVRSAFRQRVKSVHPDTSGETSKDTVVRLQRMLKAYEVLRVYAPRFHDLLLTPEEARAGGLRTIQVGDRSTMIRIPPFAKTGNVIVPVGDSKWRVRITVRDITVDGGTEVGTAEREAREKKRRELEEMKARESAEESAGLLKAFCDMFVKSSPASRLANWVRKAGKAA